MKARTALLKAAAFSVALAGIQVSALAADTEWIVAAVGEKGSSWEVKRRSMDLAETKAGTPMAIVFGRVVNPDGTIELYRWYVTDQDCAAGYGKFAILELSGEYLGEVDYLKGGGSVASITAEAICEGAEYARSLKGI